MTDELSDAHRAGISRATLVRRFPTCQHLVQAMASKILDDCERALSRAGTDTAPMEQVLTALVHDYVPFAQLWNLVHVEPDVLGVPEASARADVVFDWTVSLVERGQASGLLRKDMPPTYLASAFCGIAETAGELTLEGHMGPARPRTHHRDPAARRGWLTFPLVMGAPRQ